MIVILRDVGLAIVVIVGLFLLGVSFPPLRPFVNQSLSPGYLLPEMYWGGVHDPLQFLLANVLNVLIYALAIAAIRRVSRAVRVRRP
jgi:hypothetical protein